MTTESPDLPALPEPADELAAIEAEMSPVAKLLAEKDAEIARLSAAFEDECNRTDSLLTILGLPAERCRSEGGSLIPRKVLTLMGEAKVSAALAAQQPAAVPNAHDIRAIVQQAYMALEELQGPGFLIGGVMHYRIGLILPKLNDAINALAAAPAVQPEGDPR